MKSKNPYGYTRLWYRSYLNLLYLRARWYAVETGTFLSRDWVESEPAYLYVNGNPTNFVDPTGFYGFDVHYILTRRSAFALASSLGWDQRQKFAQEVAEADEHVDTADILNPVYGCNECHFHPYASTKAHVEEAIRLGDPFLFGATLHQYQDWYSHWNEGYDEKSIPCYEPFDGNTRCYGHIQHSEQYNLRDRDKFFEEHPKKEVIEEVKKRNPQLVTYQIKLQEFDDVLIDLYLRRPYPNHSDERWRFRFNPDRYVEGSARDIAMKQGTENLIREFLLRNNDPCKINRERPSDETIRALLTSSTD